METSFFNDISALVMGWGIFYGIGLTSIMVFIEPDGWFYFIKRKVLLGAQGKAALITYWKVMAFHAVILTLLYGTGLALLAQAWLIATVVYSFGFFWKRSTPVELK